VIQVEWFKDWLEYSYALSTFWNKILGDVKILYSNVDEFVLAAQWPKGRRSFGGLFLYSRNKVKKLAVKWLDYANSLNFDVILLTEEKVDFPVDAKSYFFIWDLSKASFLEACKTVEIKILDYCEAVNAVKEVTKDSWGFSVTPRKNLHLILSAWIGDEVVGIAMLNRYNFNIDFGVHVSRRYWKKRIGTRLLVEAASIAKSKGARYLTVVRVLRGLKETKADKAAISFYRANKHTLTLRVYRLAKAFRKYFTL